MSWLTNIFQAEIMFKIAALGDTEVSFGAVNTNSLKSILQEILNSPPVDRSKLLWFEKLQNSPAAAQFFQYNGQSLMSSRAIREIMFLINSLTPNYRAEIARLAGDLQQRVTAREQQVQQRIEGRHAANLKVTSFRLLQSTSNYYTFALSWTSHLPDKPRGYMWEGIGRNPIKESIEQRLGIQLQRDKKNLPNEWLVVGLTPQAIPQLQQIFDEFGYDSSAIAAVNVQESQGITQSKFPLQFENATQDTGYHLAVDLAQFAGRENDLLPAFMDIAEKIFTVKGTSLNSSREATASTVTAQLSDRVLENIAKKRENIVRPYGEYFMQGKSRLFLRGSFNVYMEFSKLLGMKGFDTTDLFQKALRKGSELRKSGHIQVHRIINGILDGYYVARANRQYRRDKLGFPRPDTEKFDGEVKEFWVKKTGQDPFQLMPKQIEDVRWLYSRQSALLGDETGAGKSEQLIVAAAMRTKQQNLWDTNTTTGTPGKLATGKVLVFTLASVVEQFATRILQTHGLPDTKEFLMSPECPVKLRMEDMSLPSAKWLVLSYGTVNVLTQAQQERQMGDTEEADDAVEVVDAQAIGTSAQRQAKVTALMQQIRAQNFDVLIMDECHMVKNSTSNTSKNIELLGKTIPFKWGASATTAANKPQDLHRQLLASGNSMGFMDPRRFSQKYTGMKSQKIRGTDKEYYADPSSARDFLNIAREEHQGFDNLDLAAKNDLIMQLSNDMLRPIVDSQIKSVTDLHAMLILTDVYHRKTKKQVRPDIPEHTRNPVWLPTGLDERLALTEEVTNKLQNMRADGQNTDSPLARLTAYRIQMAIQKVPHSTRAAMDIVRRGEKVLIFTCFQDSATALHKSLQSALQPHGMEAYVTMGEGTGTQKKTNMIEEFRNPNSNVKAFVLGVLSSGTGLDLPNIVNNVIVNDISWTPKDADQVEGRAFRINSREPVTTHYMVLQDTPDAVIYSTVQKKRDISQRIQEIDERYAEKIRNNQSTDQELKEAQEQHWALVTEQLIAETAVQHFWTEQQRMLANPAGRSRVAARENWLQKQTSLIV